MYLKRHPKTLTTVDDWHSQVEGGRSVFTSDHFTDALADVQPGIKIVFELEKLPDATSRK